ncbi:MAG: hypothetical protein IKO82_03540 [Prevotella sp.]|nr:hypothetical protein [Prevotella sp.]
MYTITSNASGTRTIQISDTHLATISQYSLFRNLVDSNGIVDDSVLEKLRLNVRSLIESTNASDPSLLDFCFEVLYHPNMKPVALRNLLVLYTQHAD